MKNVVVTGAGTGLGAAIAERFAAAGDRVGVFDIDGEAAAKVAAPLKDAVALVGDASDEASVEEALDVFDATPDVIVSNAGILRTGPLIDHDIEDFRRVIDVNLTGVFITARAAARRMAANGGGSIVNMSSIAGMSPSVSGGAYVAAKSAVIYLTQQMALEWGPLGIRVNSIAPGFIDAGMQAPFLVSDEVRDRRAGGPPLRRLGTAEEVAEAAYFLASDAASYISGENIAVDGGVIRSVLAQLPRD